MTIVARIVPICVKSQVRFWPLTMTETASVLAMSSTSMSGPLRKLKSCLGWIETLRGCKTKN